MPSITKWRGWPKRCASRCWAPSAWNGGARRWKAPLEAQPRNHDVARGLAALFATKPLALADFEAIIAARAFDSNAERFADLAALETYLDASGGGIDAAGDCRFWAAIRRWRARRRWPMAWPGCCARWRFHNRRHKLYMPLDLLEAVGLTPENFFDAGA